MENCGSDIAYASHAVVLAKRITPAELRTVESRDKTSELRLLRLSEVLSRFSVPKLCPEVLCSEVLCSVV